MIMIGSARIDENGKACGGRAGDQTGKEVSTQAYYEHAYGWRIFRAFSTADRLRLAAAMMSACDNDNIGYDQTSRTGIIKALKTAGSISRISTPTECDCSSLVRACIIEACGRDIGNFTTLTEPQALLKSGLFKDVTGGKTPLLRGDILVTKKKGHTVIVTASTGGQTVRGVVTCASLYKRRSPSVAGKIVGVLHRGDTVEITEIKGTWACIDPAGVWCSTKYLDIIRE